MKLRNKVAVVTGGGSGIGRCIVHELATQGATVVIGELNAEIGFEAERELRASGGNGLFIQTDISDSDQCRSLIDKAAEMFGKLNILVNNAGVNFVKPTLEVTDRDWEHVIAVDLRGTFIASQQALRIMVQQRSGSIINIGSVHSTATLSGAAPYAAAKAAVVQLTKALAVEFSGYGIRINCVSPGAIATQIWKDAEASAPDRIEFLRHWLGHIPIRRVGLPQEIATVVAFFASDEASYITGANLVADGGMTSMLTGSESSEEVRTSNT